jgi:hypothetical protein
MRLAIESAYLRARGAPSWLVVATCALLLATVRAVCAWTSITQAISSSGCLQVSGYTALAIATLIFSRRQTSAWNAGLQLAFITIVSQWTRFLLVVRILPPKQGEAVALFGQALANTAIATAVGLPALAFVVWLTRRVFDAINRVGARWTQ